MILKTKVKTKHKLYLSKDKTKSKLRTIKTNSNETEMWKNKVFNSPDLYRPYNRNMSSEVVSVVSVKSEQVKEEC